MGIIALKFLLKRMVLHSVIHMKNARGTQEWKMEKKKEFKPDLLSDLPESIIKGGAISAMHNC